jgi:DNA topoisomerase-1
VRTRTAFRYVDAGGRTLKDAETLARIRALAIPPAWTEVWICPYAEGHLQATGRDARGRKQYRYHARWREVRDEVKYGRMIAFGQALARIRRRVARDLKRPGMPRERVLATVVRLLETTLIRVGNEEYVRTNGSFGLTTLRDKHARVRGTRIQFQFRGKSGKWRSIELADKRLARLVKRCRDLPGDELFQYLDDSGQCRSIGSADVNDYLRSIAGEEFTAKDFRTWAGTVLAATTLIEGGSPSSGRAGKRRIVEAIRLVSERLGNTLAVCRKCYVHPAVLESYLDGTLLRDFSSNGARPIHGLRGPEQALLSFLKCRLNAGGRRTRVGRGEVTKCRRNGLPASA